MSRTLRILLIVGAIIVMATIFSKIKRGKIRIDDSRSWVMIALLLVILAVFPQIAYYFSEVFGFMSPSNFVFLVIIGIMLTKMFSSSSKRSVLNHKVDSLNQEVALLKKELDEAKREGPNSY